MQKVLCFGELLLRLSPDTEGSWISSNNMPVHIGGAELNVATALARWKASSAFCTAIPDNYLSKQITGYLAQNNIDTTPIQFCGSRIGLYYLPQGLDVKNAGVIYDRAGSSFATLKPRTINWNNVLEGVGWFHFSAICPALSQEAADVCLEAMEAASKKNIFISVDLNYRSKLWQYGKQPHEVMPQLAKFCNLIMGNVWAAQTMLGIPVDPALVNKDQKDLYLQQARQTSEEITRRYSRCSTVANTFRFDHTGAIRYYTTLYHDGQWYVSRQYDTNKVIDKVGSGDCFMAGLIYGHLRQWDAQQIIEFATAAAFKKLFIKGDATTSSVEEIRSQYA
ncbi:MAG TPA: sugar kinase [Chitinophagaceae bacterium]|nr:sugar kinase [Chitinophagaceae bacterium]